MAKEKKQKYYTLDNILTYKADYNVIYGERSNGKTTAVIGHALKEYIQSGYKNQLAIVRRWEEDFKGSKGQQMFEGIIALKWLEKWTNGQWNSLMYRSGRCYLALYDEEGERKAISENPFAFMFAISQQEHYKSTSYPNVTNILFDEFITREYYLPDEFIQWQNLISTIVRDRDNVTIFMCGNTVNKFCPYFAEMGLKNVKKQEQGTIDIYSYGESTLKVAVEYSTMGDKKVKKKSNKYFAFNNPKLQMITNGAWEIDIYPHLPCKYTPKEIKSMYFIQFDETTLQCEIIKSKQLKSYFTYIHLKTTPIQEDNKDIVFNCDASGKRNYRRNITISDDNIGRIIYSFFKTDKVFYQNNDIGEVVRNYIEWCRSSII